MRTDADADVYLVGSAGANVVDNVWADPALSRVPAAGVYVNVPATDAVAFSCESLNAVP
jgi:hypothetical protein